MLSCCFSCHHCQLENRQEHTQMSTGVDTADLVYAGTAQEKKPQDCTLGRWCTHLSPIIFGGSTHTLGCWEEEEKHEQVTLRFSTLMQAEQSVLPIFIYCIYMQHNKIYRGNEWHRSRDSNSPLFASSADHP